MVFILAVIAGTVGSLVGWMIGFYFTANYFDGKIEEFLQHLVKINQVSPEVLGQKIEEETPPPEREAHGWYSEPSIPKSSKVLNADMNAIKRDQDLWRKQNGQI